MVRTLEERARAEKIRAAHGEPSEKPAARREGTERRVREAGKEAIHEVMDWLQRQGRQLLKQGRATAVSMT